MTDCLFVLGLIGLMVLSGFAGIGIGEAMEWVYERGRRKGRHDN